MRGACHRAALRADPLAPSGLQPLRRLLGGAFSLQHGRRRSIEFRGILWPRKSVFLCRHTRPAGLALACQFGSRRRHHHWRNQCHDVTSPGSCHRSILPMVPWKVSLNRASVEPRAKKIRPRISPRPDPIGTGYIRPCLQFFHCVMIIAAVNERPLQLSVAGWSMQHHQASARMGGAERYPSIAFCVMGIAEFIIGRAFARPVGSTHPTNCLAPTRWRAMTLANIVARMERSEIRESRDAGPRIALRSIRATAVVICPSGGLLTGVSSLISDFPKDISVPTYPKSILELSSSRPTEGRFAIVTDVGHGMRWTRQRFARDGIAGRVERLVSDQQRADERCCSVRRSRVVLTPRRWRQVCGC